MVVVTYHRALVSGTVGTLEQYTCQYCKLSPIGSMRLLAQTRRSREGTVCPCILTTHILGINDVCCVMCRDCSCTEAPDASTYQPLATSAFRINQSINQSLNQINPLTY